MDAKTKSFLQNLEDANQVESEDLTDRCGEVVLAGKITTLKKRVHAVQNIYTLNRVVKQSGRASRRSLSQTGSL